MKKRIIQNVAIVVLASTAVLAEGFGSGGFSMPSFSSSNTGGVGTSSSFGGSSVNSASFDGALGGASSSFGSSGGSFVSDLLGDIGAGYDFALECDLDFDFSLQSPDICGALGTANLQMPDFSFMVGECNVGADSVGDCESTFLKDFCQSKGQGTVDEIAGDVMSGVDNVLDAGSFNMEYTSEGQSGQCGTSSEEKKKAQTFSRAARAARTAAMKRAVAPSSREEFYIKKCVATAIDAGKGEAEAAEACAKTPGERGEIVTHAEVIASQNRTAAETLSPTLKGVASGARENESRIAQDLVTKCGSKETASEIEQCEKDYFENTYAIDKMKEEMHADIARKDAARLTLYEEAALGKWVVIPTEEEASRFVQYGKEAMADFRALSRRALSQQTLVKSFFARLSVLKKESADLALQKAEHFGKPFYPAQVTKYINDEMENADAN